METFLTGMILSVPLFFIISKGSPPRWPVQIILAVSAFTTAVCWLSILADEIVNVLEALGLILNIEAGTMQYICIEHRSGHSLCVCRHVGNSSGRLISERERERKWKRLRNKRDKQRNKRKQRVKGG